MAVNTLAKITARAKAIRRKNPGKAWQACIKSASAEMRGGSKKTKSKVKKTSTPKKPKTKKRSTESVAYHTSAARALLANKAGKILAQIDKAATTKKERTVLGIELRKIRSQLKKLS